MTPNYTNWQLSIAAQGDIVTGADDISQTILLILATVKGSDPFRPEFGSDIFQYFDQPINIAGPGIVKEIISAVSLWEKRVAIVQVDFEHFEQFGDPAGIFSGIKFSVSWVTAGGESGNTNLLIASESSPGSGYFLTLITDDEGNPILSDQNQLLLV